MSKYSIKQFLSAAAVVLLLPSLLYAGSGSSVISYQGQLKRDGVPVSGEVDLEISLWDARSGGTQVGPPRVLSAVQVAHGLFQVELDFGRTAFSNGSRFLEIEVDGQVLTPRQAISAVPISSATRGIFVDEQDNVGIGTSTPNFSLSLGASLSHTKIALFETGATNHFGLGVVPGQFSFHLNGSGARYGFYDSDDLTNEVMTIQGTGNVGLGTTSPKQRLHNIGDYYGRGHMYLFALEGDGSDGTAYLQARDDSGASSIGMRLRTQEGGQVRDTMHLTPDGDVGIGTTTPDCRLHVEGGTEASSVGGGFIQAGATTGRNVVIDENEIMARNNGGASELHINKEGGEIVFGGRIAIGLEIVTAKEPFYLLQVYCPKGKRLLAGACSGGAAVATGSYPRLDLRGWVCEFDGIAGNDNSAYVVCANVR